MSKGSTTDEDVQRSDYELFDDFEIDDRKLDSIGEFSKNIYI